MIFKKPTEPEPRRKEEKKKEEKRKRRRKKRRRKKRRRKIPKRSNCIRRYLLLFNSLVYELILLTTCIHSVYEFISRSHLSPQLSSSF